MAQLYVVGIGPGTSEKMTFEAVEAIKKSDVICGYETYIKLIENLTMDKEIISTPMTQEIKRCNLALLKSREGKTVSVISSGDAGVYGMAGLILELAKNEDKEIEIIIIPGISAAMSGASVLGAPLMNDFAIISLSDLMTPWEIIEKRLMASAIGDFVICLYNPSSKTRSDYLKKAVEIILKNKNPKTVCGFVKKIDRQGQTSGTMLLKDLASFEADMFTTVFIGNSETYLKNGKMITPRGYQRKLS